MEVKVIEKKNFTWNNKTIILLFIVVLGFVSYFIMQSQKGGLEYETNATIGTMPGVDLEQRQQELQQLLDDNMIAFSINTNPIFASGTSEGNLMIENPAHNNKLLIAEMHLKDTDEIIYTSKAIKPDSYLENVKLDKVLDAGVYDTIVYLKAYNLESQKYISQTGAEVSVTIQS